MILATSFRGIACVKGPLLLTAALFFCYGNRVTASTINAKSASFNDVSAAVALAVDRDVEQHALGHEID